MKQQQQSKKKKKRSKPRATPTPTPTPTPTTTATNTTTTTASVKTASRNGNGTQTEAENLAALVDAFDSVSVEGSGDSNKGEEVTTASDSVSIGSWSSVTANSSSSVSGSSSSSSSGSLEGDDVGRERGCRGSNGKQKRIVAVTGTVSTVLGKEYVRRRPLKVKEFECGKEKEDMEQFLCSMLGDDSELSFGVVRDVLCE